MNEMVKRDSLWCLEVLEKCWNVRTDPAHLQSLNVAYTTAGQTTDGNVGVSADVWFQVDNTYTIPAEWLEETDAIAALPDLEGYGNVHNLHQAMLRDSSGRLQSLVGQFINETDPASRKLTPLVLCGS